MKNKTKQKKLANNFKHLQQASSSSSSSSPHLTNWHESTIDDNLSTSEYFLYGLIGENFSHIDNDR
ncbi:hypothetical protein DERF_008291 [Dermatophagoides farinae]|uniref:Uncharacterized protein n=1 Tax=Dermatophagoides farinae TaxID=6954 RepID=A0A922I2W9_DERFA|nr:hypothetical protein DERF_008291 [Dermatophagoides farinae]